MIKIAKNNLLPEDANLILNDVVPKHEFNIHMGTSIKNLQELAEALEIMDNDAFKHHVTKEKNDFSNWVKDIIEDVELSNDLLKAKTRKKTFETFVAFKIFSAPLTQIYIIVYTTFINV